MKKELLLKLRRLDATPKMMKLAAEDKPTWVRRYEASWCKPEEKYRRSVYMRCQTLSGILKVAFFFPHLMRGGRRRAVYELFINRETGEFITYDVLNNKWRDAKLDMLEWPPYFSLSGTEKWINPEGNRSIKSYLGAKNGGFKGLLEYQLQVRADQLKQRYRKETDPWDLDMEQIPPLPKDWDRWVDKVGITQNYIFYQYERGGAKTGWCGWCEKTVPIKNPKHNKYGRCSCCGHVITFKSEKKAGLIVTEREKVYLLQRCEDGFIIREFNASRRYEKGKYKKPRKSCVEVRRTIYDKTLAPRSYFWGDYKQHEIRWIKTWSGSNYSVNGRVYGKTVPALAKRELERTGLPEMIRALDKLDPQHYLDALRRCSMLEQLAKAGLTHLTYDISENLYAWKDKFAVNGSELHKTMEINRRQFHRLRDNDGGVRYLDWLQFEVAHKRKEIPDPVISWFARENIQPGKLDFIRDRMSETQVCNYLQRQMRESGETSKQLINTWKDYLAMAQRLKMDTSDAIIFRCKKLRQRHDELVKRCGSNKSLAIQAGEIVAKYPHVDEICAGLKEKYEYTVGEYLVLAPTCIEDILTEGEALQHCISKSERYFGRIETHEAYILFLRKASEPEKPWYTLEIEPGGTVRQKRTMYDRQNKDLEAAEKFLQAWQKVVAGRMTEEDRRMAADARVLREQGFVELRESGKIVPSGELRGKLLVEVLQADLMENNIDEKEDKTA